MREWQKPTLSEPPRTRLQRTQRESTQQDAARHLQQMKSPYGARNSGGNAGHKRWKRGWAIRMAMMQHIAFIGREGAGGRQKRYGCIEGEHRVAGVRGLGAVIAGGVGASRVGNEEITVAALARK